MAGAAAALADAGHYLHWGWISISLANALIIAAMVVVFVLALLLPFPGGHDAEPAAALPATPPGRNGSRP